MGIKIEDVVKNMGIKIKDIVKAAPLLIDAARFISKQYGLVHKRAEAEIQGKKGFLIWDFLAFNEITFEDENGKIISFFVSLSDEDTEQVWNELVEKYGI